MSLQMKRLQFNKVAMMAVALLALLSSCSETDDTVEEYPNWQSKNEAFFNSKYNAARQQSSAGSTEWKVIKTYARQGSTTNTPTDHIIVRVLREGLGSGCPLYTDSVRVHYRGQLLASTTHVDKNDSELGFVFDKSWSTDVFDEEVSVPAKLGVGSVVDGFATALQHMHIGDRWLVYIPYQLGYGSTGSSTIPAYSTLVFDIALAAYYRAGTKVPAWTANEASLWDAME